MKGETGKAYGVGLVRGRIVGPDCRIVGFYRGLPGDRRTAEGRPGGTHDDNPANAGNPGTISGKASDADRRGAIPQPRMDDHRPTFAPLSYTLQRHSSARQQSGNFGGPTFTCCEVIRRRRPHRRLIT